MLRGSWVYGAPVSGSCTKKLRYQGLVRPEGVEHRRGRVGQQLHVGLVDLLEPAD